MKIGAAFALMLGSSAVLANYAQPSTIMSLPSYDEPTRPWTTIEEVTDRQRCRDRIEQVRAVNGKLKLDRSPAGSDEPLLHYAVDHRVDGCGVLVPVADPQDIQVPPEPGTPQLRSARPRS